MGKAKNYILFPSLTEGMKLETLLQKERLKYDIVSVPSKIGSACNISIMYNKKDEEKIKKLADKYGVKILGFYSLDKKGKH
ncbi:DUF3343 domain-containing protein [Clostridium sp. DJ247]|uniref:DUF3343 domain-containing protein n=1 Tax=Clostridium sp. DJ247 TaxID=2726188 RepID=UPI0016256DE2|nr:DUF3343 domain-containing protein [Clostridium sp. DJ247]MBC2579834.1 DUF3343 domain-containing protein [Clostridium sp. DJ247]